MNSINDTSSTGTQYLFPATLGVQKILTLSLLFLLMVPISMTAQTSTELLPFNTVKILGLIEVDLIKSDENRIEVTAFGDDEEKLKISQQNKTLKISTIKSLVNEDLEIRVKVYYQELEALYVAAGARVELGDTIRGNEFYVRAGSGSEVHAMINATRLDAQAAEGAHLTLSGYCEELRAGANTGGILDGHRISCDSGRLRAGTGGEVSATIINELDARANTGGIIRYAGTPTTTSERIILGGEISKLFD